MFKTGDRVVKSKRYNEDQYCKHGGDPDQVPIGTKGIVKSPESERSHTLTVRFDNGRDWQVDASEMSYESDLCTNIQDLIPKLKY